MRFQSSPYTLDPEDPSDIGNSPTIFKIPSTTCIYIHVSLIVGAR